MRELLTAEGYEQTREKLRDLETRLAEIEKRTDLGAGEIKMLIQGNAQLVFKFGDLTTNKGSLTVGLAGKLKCFDPPRSGGCPPRSSSRVPRTPKTAHER